MTTPSPESQSLFKKALELEQCGLEICEHLAATDEPPELIGEIEEGMRRRAHQLHHFLLNSGAAPPSQAAGPDMPYEAASITQILDRLQTCYAGCDDQPPQHLTTVLGAELQQDLQRWQRTHG